jgi:transcription initiation factor TFIIA large subunit
MSEESGMRKLLFIIILEDKSETEAKDFLLAQYEKVHRVRNKWKCTFKDAILHINEKEYVFEKVVGELERDW